MNISDEQLMRQWREGDDAAFEQLFLRHYSQVYQVIYRLLGVSADADDLTQEVFLTLYRQPPSYISSDLLAWLCRVALNRAYNMLRRERRERQRLAHMYEPPVVIDPQVEVARADEQARVRLALADLPERQARLLLLRYAGLSYAEIAQVLDIAPGSIGTLLARAERAFLTVYERATAAEVAWKTPDHKKGTRVKMSERLR